MSKIWILSCWGAGDIDGLYRDTETAKRIAQEIVGPCNWTDETPHGGLGALSAYDDHGSELCTLNECEVEGTYGFPPIGKA